MLGFPRDPIIEWYLDKWRDISADVRQDPGLSITHGRKDENATASPARCTFTLDDTTAHGNGSYHPNNPQGTWYGTLGRNRPVRVGLRVGTDSFTRTSASGWGTSTSLGAWATPFSSGTVASSVASNTGRHSITTTGAFIASYLDDVDIKNVTVTVDTSVVGVTGVTGGNLEPANILLRGTGVGTDYYMLRVTIDNTATIKVAIFQGNGTNLSGTGGIFTPIVWTGQTLRVRFQADGSTLRGKVWLASGDEPLTWDVEFTDTTPLSAGWVGIRSGVASGNTTTKPVVFSYDNLDVQAPRFYGETSQLTPQRSIEHANRTTDVECASVRRRLTQGTKVLDSAPRRYITRTTLPFNLVEYWPLDEPPSSPTRGASVNGSLAAYTLQNSGDGSGSIRWGADTGLPQFSYCAELSNSLRFRCDVSPSRFPNNTWGFYFMFRLPQDADGWGLVNLDDGSQVIINFQAGGRVVVYAPDSLTTVFDFVMENPTDVWHKFAYSITESGSDSIHRIGIDGKSPAAYQNTETGLLGSPNLGMFFSTADQTFQIAQVLFTREAITTGTPTYLEVIHNDIFSGRSGEAAGTRFVRLANEEDVSYDMIGDPTATATVGPQRQDTVFNLLRECVAIDQGSEYDSRGAAALGFRTLRSAVSQDALATLDYAAYQVAEPFGPTSDDQQTLNDVTAERPLGGTRRVQQLTGSLNVQDPGTATDAVGRYDATVTVNVPDDFTTLFNQAGWRVHVGTNAEPRFPTVAVNLAAPAVSSSTLLTQRLLDLGVDDALTITNADAALIFDDVRQLVRGYTERIGTAYEHQIVYNTTPASVYDGATANATTPFTPRVGHSTAVTASSFVAGTGTSLVVNMANGYLWDRTAPAFHVRVGGVVLNVTSIATNTTTQQTFTVTQTTVNGVTRTIPAGTRVDVEFPVYVIP